MNTLSFCCQKSPEEVSIPRLKTGINCPILLKHQRFHLHLLTMLSNVLEHKPLIFQDIWIKHCLLKGFSKMVWCAVGSFIIWQCHNWYHSHGVYPLIRKCTFISWASLMCFKITPRGMGALHLLCSLSLPRNLKQKIQIYGFGRTVILSTSSGFTQGVMKNP